MNKCSMCGEFIEKGHLCSKCAENLIESDINRQLNKGEVELTIKIGELLAKETANLILRTLQQSIEIGGIKLLARGWLISRAVDVLEILKRELNLNEYDIETNTSELTSKAGKSVKVSEIKITLYSLFPKSDVRGIY